MHRFLFIAFAFIWGHLLCVPAHAALIKPADNISVAAVRGQAGYTGHIRDKATGLNYMQARYYDPVIGRFLSVDPVTFMDTGDTNHFNRYVYGNNDPINKIDPNGADAIDIQYVDQPITPTGKNKPIPQWISGGHSGVIAISPTGLTKYREYGRYGGPSGAVRPVIISDIVYGKNNVPTKASLRNVLSDALKIGARNKSSELEVTIDFKADDFEKMMKEVSRWDSDVEYSWKTRKTCHDFCTAVRREGGGGGFRTSRQVFKSDLTSETLDETVDKLHKKWEDVLD